MAAGDLAASTPTYCEGAAAVETAVDALNLAAATDFIKIGPVSGREDVYIVFTVERAAA